MWECCGGSLPAGGGNHRLGLHKNGIIHPMKSETGEVCIPNISIKERRKRLKFGLIVFAVYLAVLAVMLAAGISLWWRIGLFPLFAAATSGFFQWRDKT